MKNPLKFNGLYLAVREGFEPSIRCRIHTFQACSFSHSDTSPNFTSLKWLSEHATRAFLPTSSVGSHSDSSPNFGLWFNVFSQHGSLRHRAGTGRNLGERPAGVNGF